MLLLFETYFILNLHSSLVLLLCFQHLVSGWLVDEPDQLRNMKYDHVHAALAIAEGNASSASPNQSAAPAWLRVDVQFSVRLIN
jgi:hypothetical protein